MSSWAIRWSIDHLLLCQSTKQIHNAIENIKRLGFKPIGSRRKVSDDYFRGVAYNVTYRIYGTMSKSAIAKAKGNYLQV